MKRIISFILVAVLIMSMLPSTVVADSNIMAELYVSPNGNDAGDGSAEQPLKSMDKAKEVVSGLNDDMTGDIVVYFEDGEYLLDSTVTFTEEDSGTNGFNVIYKAKEHARPVITSGQRISNWTDANDSERPGLLAADANIENTRQFYVDGEMAVRARGKIRGSMQRGGDRTVYTTYNGNHNAYTGFISDNTDILNWRNPEFIEFVWDISWAHRISTVSSITPRDGKSFIEMEWDSFRMGQIAGGVQITGAPDYVENAYELLDEPGEWYFDVQEKRIYYMPKSNQDMNTVEAIIPSVENLIHIEGTLNNKASNISFEGFEFTYNTWLYPSYKGWPEQQANFAHDPRDNFNMHAYSMEPGAAILTKMTDGITFNRCSFQNLGSAAINMLEGSVRNTVKNCTFKNISAGGILIGGVSITQAHPLMPGDTIENHIENGTAHDDRLIVKDNTVTNNYFNGIGTEYKGSIAIVVGYTDGTVITNNTIRDVAYSGISVGWGWGFWDQGGRYRPNGTPDNETPIEYPRFPLGDAAVSRNNVIEYNDISQCMMKLHDGAGIYTLGDMPDSSIKGNLIYDNLGWPGGIYLDEGSGGMHVDENITYNVQVNLNHNVREHTYGYKADHYVDGGNNYFGVSPTSSGFPAELAAKAGVQEGEDTITLPIELNKLTAPEFIAAGDRVLLEGNFGDDVGRIILSGVDNPVVLDETSGYIISWQAKSILFRVPGGVTSGLVYAESANGIATNTKRIAVGDFTEVLFEDDFESYTEGALANQESAYTAVQDSIIIEKNEGDGQFARINKSGGADARLELAADWRDVMLAMDFRYDVNPHDFGGFFLSPRFVDHGNKYLTLLTPNYTNGLGYQRYVDGSLNGPGGGGQFNYQIGTWYSTKIAIVGQEMKVKIWEKARPEPSLWTSTVTFEGLSRGGLLIQLTSLRNDEKASIDNLKMLGYEAGVTTDLSADKTMPVTTAVVSGNLDLEQAGVYNGQVKIELSARDNDSGVAEIEYRINNGESSVYTEPLLFTESGEYSVSYRAVDKAGNAEEMQNLQFTVDLQPGEVIFKEDFEEYPEGTWTDLATKGYEVRAGNRIDALEIVTDESKNQLLKFNGIGRDVRLFKNANWENTQMSFDYLYTGNLVDYNGFYSSNYFQSTEPSSDSMYGYLLLPNWGGLLFQQNINGNASNTTAVSNSDYPLQADTWYSIKTKTTYSQMAVKIWEKDTEEPAEWMATRDVSGLNGGGGLYFNFLGRNGENTAYLDNVEIKGYATSSELTRVTFAIQPQDAQIIFEDDSVYAEADGSYLLADGTYAYIVSAAGYINETGIIEVKGEGSQSIHISLQQEEQVVREGWLEDGDGWRYELTDGEFAIGWKNVDGKWYYFGEDTYMETGWVLDGTTWYYLDKSGAMRTGWIHDGISWYFLANNGAMQTGWLQDGSNWYFLANHGAMQNGWIFLEGKWYHLNMITGAMQIGWVQDGNNWYYTNDSGAMLFNQWIDGWWVGPNGRWIPDYTG